MKKFFYKIIANITAGITTLLLIFSCDDSLNTTSETSLSSASIFETTERIEALVNGAYKSLKSSDLYSGRLLHCNDLRGEEFICLTENSLGGGYAWQQNLSSTTGEVNSIWTQAYRVINNANILIDGLAKSEEGLISDELKRNYTGEVRLLRALAYFTLVTTYARPYIDNNGNNKGVPLRLKPESTSANNDLERSDVSVIYQQIINDLDTAELFLPEKYSTALLNTTRAHKNTAIALKTRVYLSKHDFAKVREEARKIVAQNQPPFSAASGVEHRLHDDITTIFSSDYTTTESIFSMPMSASDPPSGSVLATVYNSAPNYALNHTEPGILSNIEWKDTDARRQFVRQKDDLFYLTKYSKVSPAIDYIPVVRYAEVLLNYAEAEARGGDLNKAIALLQAVRHRSDADYSFPANSLTQAEILNTIRIERRIELLGEGFRTTDVLRDLLTFPDKPSRSSYTSREVGPDDEGYVFPLPNNEILTNKLLLQ
ncbi:MAG: RagB/SusD family nutrient uptake outer membrane protein [Prevotellaceae bacterium]|nr:RagB/SusD family nutrient uptake outer membrane protein [Prevotellaceae bacterium]